ncbi:hypothetical protein [Streptomyces sp. E5N91]|uniref:hypothetical protein n=1 Tax=Streptomyces sp. E5N91 TaxID=1851996 RepID=UPI000EF59FA2|nr:hypothetical protein [Streptomyces sp. E5N91]
MRIRITAVTSVSDGSGRRYRSGWEGTVPDQLGRSWVAAGHAVEVGSEDTEPDAREGSKGKRTASRRAPRTAKKTD